MFKRLTVIAFIFIYFNNLYAQEEFEKYVEKVAQVNIEGYFKPFVTGFGTAINSGLYHTAKTHKFTGFDVTIVGIGVLIPDKDKTFTSSQNQEWSTIFGKERDKSLPAENLNPGGLNFDIVPLAVPQFSFGLGDDFETLLRFLQFNLGDIGNISLYGIGLKHNLKRYFPNIPLFPDLSVQGAYQIFKAGNIVDSKSWSVNSHISKSLLFLTLFAGLGLENTSVDLNYIYKTESQSQTISKSIKGENNIRFVGGMMAKLGLLNLNGEINLGAYNAVSAGIGISFR